MIQSLPKSVRWYFLMASLLVSLFASAQDKAGIRPGKILVKLKSVAVAQVQRNAGLLAARQRPETFSTGLQRFDGVSRLYRANRMVRVFPQAGRMEAKQRKYGLDRWYMIQVDSSTSIETAVASFRQVAEVEYAQPAYSIKSIQPSAVISRLTNTPAKPLDAAAVNDPFYPLQWHFHNTGQVGGYAGADINLPAAWQVTAGKPNVIVDVVDEGVDYKHEDLAANMWVNQAEANGIPGYDDDGNGYIDDVYGYNFADQMGQITPGDHGTHTAGTIAAVNNNGVGVAGIAGGTGIGDGARIMSSEIFSINGADGAGTAAAIVYGANNGAVISQNSWGYTAPNVYDQVVLDAIDYFSNEAGRDANGNQVGPMNGGVVIFAAGNSNISDPSYPGYYPTAIAVGATTVFDNKASYSNYGNWVDISAPGGDVTGAANQEVASTLANNQYGYMAGTSMACPHVSGIAALIISQFGKPGFTNDDLKNRLFHTADNFLAMNPAYNGQMGAGRADAGRALQPDQGLAPFPVTNLSGVSNQQNSIDLHWTAPADPDNGNAQSYYLYYARHAFDSAQKDTLSRVFINQALAAGSAESYTISGLKPSTDYYVSLFAKDLWGNLSPMSNQIKVTTLPGAVVNVPAQTLQLDIDASVTPVKSTSFKLGNDGLGSMNWNAQAVPISSSWARASGFNDTLRYVDQDYTYSYLGDDARVIFSAATRFDVKTKPFNLTHVGNFLRTQGVVRPINIYIYKGGADPSKGSLLLKQTITDAPAWGDLLITKLDGMYLFQPGEWFWIVYEYDPAFGYVQGYEDGADASLENYFLTSSNGGKTWTSIASQYAAVRFNIYGLSNEGYPGSLISLQPASGTLAGQSSANITVNGNAATIRNGTYNYRVHVNSNDLNSPSVGIPVLITVKGQKARLTSKEGLLDCKSVFIGKDGTASIKLYNAGLAILDSLKFTSDNALFTVLTMPDSLYPGDSAQFIISFRPVKAGLQTAKIKISSNGGTLNLSATGIGVDPPVMDLSGIPLQIVTKADSTGQNSFVISNKKGKFPLSYSFPEVAAIARAKAKGILAQGTEPFGQYVWIDSQEPNGPVYQWNDISITGTDITRKLANDPKTASLFPLGFPMRIYGDTISQLYVTSMGMLSFNYPGALNSNGIDLPLVNDGVNGCIAPLWYQEMRPVVRGKLRVFVKYEPGKFIVQYNDLEYFAGNVWDYGSYSMGKATFQVILNSNGKIEVNYRTVSNAVWPYQAVIGLESRDETKGFAVSSFNNSTPWTPQDNVSLWIVPVTPRFITSVIPAGGAVAPGDSVRITVGASAAGLTDSTYTNLLALTTNDPLKERLDLPVNLTVTGKREMLRKTDTLAFGQVFKKATAKLDAVFLNAGTKPVKLLTTVLSNNAFTTDQQPVLVPAQSELRITVAFSPTAETDYSGTLKITTDDPAHKSFTVQLKGKGVPTPALAYQFTGGNSKTLNTGGQAAASVKLSNTGDADLKLMLEKPQWLIIDGKVQGQANGLDSAHSYSIHQNLDSNGAAYEWIELANGLGKSSLVDVNAVASQEIKLPFTFPYFGKNYTSLYMNFMGDVTLTNQRELITISPTLPSPLPPNGIISTTNFAFHRLYDMDKGQWVGQFYYYADTSKMVVEFVKASPFDFFSIGYTTFETIYYKDGRIKMMYKEGETESNFTYHFLIGLENEDGSDGVLAYNRSFLMKNRTVVEFVPSLAYTLKPGQSVTVPATWTTRSLTDGLYTDQLVLTTNDPTHTVVRIPLSLQVNGQAHMKTTDTVNFGKVVAYTSPSNRSTTYTRPFIIRNDGKKTISITNIDFSNNNLLALQELSDFPPIQFPVTLGPGDELLAHVVFTPDSTLPVLKEKIKIQTDLGTTLSIPVIARVSKRPVLVPDTNLVNVMINQKDSFTRKLGLTNAGNGGLDYTASVVYHRPGIAYNAIGAAKPLTKASPESMKTLFGTGVETGLLGSSQTYADSILMYEPGRQFVDYLGTGADENPLVTATRFNGGSKGFYLSHVGNLYRTDIMEPTTIIFRIKLGSNINTATTVAEKSVLVQPDTTINGVYLVAPLDSSILINAHEDFWIEWEYAPGMRYPQAIQYVPFDQFKPGVFYRRASSESAFQEEYFSVNYYVAAYAAKDSSGGWLRISPDTGSINPKGNKNLRLSIQGPKVVGPDQSAELVLRTNDPVVPENRVTVNVHIDQAPWLTNHDTLYVQEGDVLDTRIPVQDDGQGAIRVDLLSKDKLASIRNTDSGSYLTYKPGFDDAGLYFVTIRMTDANNNSAIDSLMVKVLNTNRSPVVVRPIGKHRISDNGRPLFLNLDTVFSDPDGDPLSYTYPEADIPQVKIYRNALGNIAILAKDTGLVFIPFTATDPSGATVTDTLELRILHNQPPVAGPIPRVILDRGATQTIDLANYFSDPDEGDQLYYTIVSERPGQALTSLNGSMLTITGLSPGDQTITVFVNDGNGGSVVSRFVVTVLNNQGDLIRDCHIKVVPNPIRGIATISFELGESRKMSIDVLNLNGRVQSRLFEGTQSAGEHSLKINLSNLMPGNYFIRFTIGDKVGLVQVLKL